MEPGTQRGHKACQQTRWGWEGLAVESVSENPNLNHSFPSLIHLLRSQPPHYIGNLDGVEISSLIWCVKFARLEYVIGQQWPEFPLDQGQWGWG